MAEPIAATLITVNLNAADLTIAALESVFAQTIAARLKVVVVDNGSTDGSAEKLRARFGDRVTLIESKTNLGFAGGNNLGFNRAEGKYLLLLNNDAVADPRWAETLIKVAERENAGMCTSKILTYSDKTIIDCAGHNLFPDGLSRSRGNWQKDDGRFDRLEETLYASGCAALYLREAVENWGGFDESFFAYQEDVDLGMKLRIEGHKCMYVPTAVVYHHGSATERDNPFSKVYLIEKNRVRVMLRFLPWTWIAVSPWHTMWRLLAAWRAARRGEGRIGTYAKSHTLSGLGWTILRAWASALLAAPGDLCARRRIMKRRRISGAEFKKTLKRFKARPEEMAFI